MSKKKLNFEMLYSKRFSCSNERPDRVGGQDVDPKFVARRRKAEEKRESFKDRDYPLEREL